MAIDTSDHWLTPDPRPTYTVRVLGSPNGRLVLEWTGRAEDAEEAKAFALQAARIAQRVAHVATERTSPDVVAKVIDKDQAVAEY